MQGMFHLLIVIYSEGLSVYCVNLVYPFGGLILCWNPNLSFNAVGASKKLTGSI